MFYPLTALAFVVPAEPAGEVKVGFVFLFVPSGGMGRQEGCLVYPYRGYGRLVRYLHHECS